MLLADNRHLCIIDPTGAWHGLRSNAAGDGPGFGIPIFGGDHGDVRVAPDQGDAVGKIVAAGVSAIVDISIMDSREQRRFMLAFMRALRKKPKGNFHLIIDEADEFAPQTAPDDVGYSLVEEIKWIAKRGRLAGFVLTAITQRPADISKAVLSQVQTVIAHQLIAPQDQKAVDDYLKANGDAATRKEVMGSLAALNRGERWVYSPRLGVLERGYSPIPSTFDSSRTPEPGETVIAPKMLAQIDIGAIRDALKPIEQDKHDGSVCVSAQVADDSVKLRSELSDVRRQLAEAIAEQDRLHSVISAYQKGVEAQMAVLADISWPSIPRKDGTMPHEPLVIAPVVPAPTLKPARQPQPVRDAAPGAVPHGCAKPLAALVGAYPATMTMPQWATVAGYKRTGGTWQEYVRRLLRAGMVEKRGSDYAATELGARSTGPVELPPPAGPELARWWASKIHGTRKLVDALIPFYPSGLTIDQLADAVEMQAAGGSFQEYVRRLIRQNIAVKDDGTVYLTREVMGA